MQDTVPAEDTEATASVAAEDMDAVDANSPAAHETAEEVIECFLPNGLHFRGTREEYHQEVMDWLDNVS